ncbi:MAG TPA: PIG-L family deacetylase [Acidimicrobiales bacterium]|nr:PIG-L family deacetylase [Acidimicrobiales bacterium]
MDSNLEVPERALAVGAHPDDIEFGCGATLAKWAASGCAISLLVCTDGSKGTWDPDSDSAELVVTRRREQLAAAHALDAAAQVIMLSWPDGELEAGLRQRWEIAAWIRRIKPDVMLAHDPWKRYRIHPDHRNAGWLATDGVVAARDPLFFPELDSPPHRPSSLLLFEADEINHVEDTTGFGVAKAAALLEHRSQFRSTMGISSAVPDPEHPEVVDFRRRLDEELREHGALAGFAEGEAFHRISHL